MVMKRVAMSELVMDAGTQVRAVIEAKVVMEYVEALQFGAMFPPVTVFHDGERYVLADGFHRVRAYIEIGATQIEAEILEGTVADALWYALRANQMHGMRLTKGDKKRAVEMALAQWPERSMNEIAAQLGVARAFVQRIQEAVLSLVDLPKRVIGRDGKNYPAKHQQLDRQHERAEVEAMVRAGTPARDIRAKLGVHAQVIADVRRDVGVTAKAKAMNTVARVAKVRELAEAGSSSRQIMAAVGLSQGGLLQLRKREGIEIPADRVMAGTRHHDSNRIIDSIVMSAENLMECTELIDYRKVDATRYPDWIDTLVQARKALDGFIKRLMKEQPHQEQLTAALGRSDTGIH